MKNKIIIIVFAAITAAAFTLLLLPADEKSVEKENRALATMAPLDEDTVFSGKFAEGFENYLSDNVGFRSVFTGFTEWLNSVKGVDSSVGKIVYADSHHDANSFGSNLLVTDNSVFEVFMNNNCEREYADAINRYASKLDKNINLYSMLIPTHLEFSEPIYANLQDSQREAIDSIYSGMSSHVKTVDAYKQLSAHKDEYIYFRTDHHWTPLGAYYGYLAFCETAGKKPVSIGSYNSHEIDNFLGYLYRFAQEPELAKYPDKIVWYDTNENETIDASMRYVDKKKNIVPYDGSLFDKGKSNYGFFLGSDHPFVLLENSANPTGKTLLIIKDSYANCFAPWVINNYHRVIMIDPRSYTADLSGVLDEFEPDEILVLNYIFAATMDGYSDLLEDLY